MTRLEVRARSRLSERFTLDVDFAFPFEAGQPVAALFGPSGCGKSTTLALIAGLLAPDEGRVALDGIALADTFLGIHLPPERRAVGLVAQDGLLFPHLTVAGNLAYAERRSRGRAHPSRDEIVDVLELAPLLARSTWTLSGGERQRAALARALISGPRLLLLDEPVSALDEAARWEALSLLERVARKFAVPTLFVSHQRAEVARIARQTARMADGRVVTCGDTAVVLAGSDEAGSMPNLFRAVYIEPDRAAIEGGATIQLPRTGPTGEAVWCRLASGAIALGGVDDPEGGTARNRLHGRVVAVEETGSRVRVAVDAGVALHADVTPETARRLALRPPVGGSSDAPGKAATLQYPHPLIRLQPWMNDAASMRRMALEQDRRISEVVERERSRLRNFIRRRVPDPRDVEDVLQDVFYELVEANRLLMPIEHITGWLFRVARNRITDLFRKSEPQRFGDTAVADEEGERLRLEDLLPSPDAGPEALYARNVLLDAIESALDELPREQREVFLAHELEGRSFKEMAAETGENVNTLLSRKRYAVLHLRKRLESMRSRT